jgi:cysteine-rich repeat protein
VCDILGVCQPPSTGIAVGFGEPCGGEETLVEGCAADGERFAGICFAAPGESNVTCEQVCLDDRHCDGGEYCAIRFTSELGICQPRPTCGDGVLGEVDEACDDGNTVSGDGCSADCLDVEYGVVCGALPELELGRLVEGTTLHAQDGFWTPCNVARARSRLYELTPPGPGRLRFEMTSDTIQTVGVRRECSDHGSARPECALTFDNPTELILQITEDQPAPLTVVVSAAFELAEGPYTLLADFVPELCGDGTIAGREVCDDGNTDSRDGCRGDCRQVEYDFYCSLATPLPLGGISGNTSDGSRVFRSDCPGDFGNAPEKLYSFVAPADGTLRVSLDQLDHDLTLALFGPCGPPAELEQLACSTVFGEDNAVEVQLKIGHEVTVMVDGFSGLDEGDYALEATFTPAE